MEIYYKVWVDAIRKVKSAPSNKGVWGLYAMIYMSIVMSMNFIFLVLIFERSIVGCSLYLLDIDIFPSENLNMFLSFFIRFVLPFVLVNYFLIFFNKRYEKLLSKYESENGKLFARYFIGSLSIPLVVLWIGILFK